MALPRYNPSEVTLQPGAASVAYNQQAQSWNNLSQKLDQWSNIAYNRLATQKEEEATQQAYKDDLEGKAFHKENVYTVYGQAYNNARTASYAARTELDLVEASTKYATQFKNDPISYEASMKGVLEGINKEVADPRLKSSISIYANKLIANQSNKLAIAAKAEADKTQLAIYEQFKNQKTTELINAISSGDTKTADLLRHQLDEYTTTLMESDVLKDDKYIEDYNNMEYSVNRGVLESTMAKHIKANDYRNAEKLYEDFSKKIQPGYTIEQYNATKSSIGTLLNTAKKQRKAELKELKDSVDIKLQDSIDILNSGKEPDFKISDSELMLASDSKKQKYAIARKAYDEVSKINNMTLQEQEAEVNKYKANPKASKIDTEVLPQVEANLKQRKLAWKNDPITQGIVELKHEDFTIDFNSPTIIDDLKKRDKQRRYNINEVGAMGDKILKDSEATQLANMLDNPSIPVEQTLNILETVETSIPNASNSVYRQINEKGATTLSYVGGLIKNGKKEDARKVLLGRQIRQEVPNAILENDVKNDIYATLGNTFLYAGKGQMKALIDSALNYSAYIAQQEGTLGNYSDGKKSLNAILGNISVRNGQNYIVPPNMSEDDVDDYIDDLNIDSFQDEFKGISKAQAIKVIQDGQLISVGINKYRVKYQGGFLTKEDGSPFVMEIK